MFYSFNDFERDIKEAVLRLKDKNYDVIVCPLRGSMTITQVLSYALEIPHIVPINIKRVEQEDGSFDACLYDEIPEELKYKRVLVVDDIYDSGVTLDLIRKHLPEADYYTLLVRGKDRDWTPLHSQCIESDEWITFWWENLKQT